MISMDSPSPANKRCDECPAKRLETALPIALQKNQEALNSISRLYSRVSNSGEPTMEFGHLVNRTAHIEDGTQIPLPLISQVGQFEHEYQISSDEKDMPPIWQVTLSAAKSIFEEVTRTNSSAPELVWAASSINPPTSTSASSPLGFEDVVILHSNGQLISNGKGLLQEAESRGFLSLSKVFFPELDEAQMSQGDRDLLTTSDFGIWVCPLTTPNVPKTIRNILKVECNRFSLPPEIPEPQGLLERTYKRWRTEYIRHGSLEPYFAAFDILAGRQGSDSMTLLFCPVLYVDRNNRIAAGANISLGIIGALEDDQVHEILMCLKALQAGLAATTAGFSQAQGRIRELHRSHQMLLRLQRPLDNLTKAFNAVQSEAQEMQSVLNAPEVALFRSHKLLTDLFTQDREIHISKTLTLRASHAWGTGNVIDDQLRMAYAYAICRIFGKEGALYDCQNVDSVEATAQQVMMQIHSGGAHNGLLSLLSRLLIADSPAQNRVFALIESFGRSRGESQGQSVERKARSLDTILKSVVFTPFKSFGSSWPTLAFQVAFFGERYEHPHRLASLQLDPSMTPFPQHAILDFVSNFCSLSSEWSSNRWQDIDYSSSDEAVEILLKYSGSPGPYRYQPDGPAGKASILPEYLAHIVRHRDDLGNSGDFLSCFGSLVKKGLGIVEREKARRGEWELLTDIDHATTMIRLGKLGSQTAVLRYDRVFDIRQEESAAGGTVVIRWSKRGDLKGPRPGFNQSQIQLKSSEEALTSPKGSKLKCALFDHTDSSQRRDQLSAALASLGMMLIGTNEASDGATVLFLHQNQQVNQTIKSFLSVGVEGKLVILISTTGDPHPLTRDALYKEFGGNVIPFLNPDGYDLDSDWAKQRFSEMLRGINER
jgi:hypothetical protein